MNDVSPTEKSPAAESPQRDAAEQQPSGEPQPATMRRLLIWPAALLLVVMWGLRIATGIVGETSMPVMMARFMGPLVCAGLILLWWLFLSRASLKEKSFGLLGIAVMLAVTTALSDKSIRGFGTMIYAIPWGMTAFAGALIGCELFGISRRTLAALVAALIGFGFWDLVRTDEIYGDFRASQSWRWEPTAEDRFLAGLATSQREHAPVAQETDVLTTAPEWPAFRGPNRDGRQPGIVLGEDWQAQPPREIWRVPVGPGWSSFSVAGDQLFTQEQRGDDEVIVCYDANSGREVWVHRYTSRFWEVVGGAGPRGTPTLSNGRLFALGAEGFLHRLNPLTGEQVWQRDIRQDADRDPPMWGFAASPLVTDGVVIVHAGGSGDKGILAYDAETGDLRWGAPVGDHSYSSPQLASVNGTLCVLMLTNDGLTIVNPATGDLLGTHDWEYEGYRVLQPLVVDDASVLLGTAMGTGTRRIELQLAGGKIATTESWTSTRMNPAYNDFVAHQGYLYGFDNNIFACLDLSTGERKWKKGRYGNGQVLLLPDADQLLVISEDGELVLLRATSDKLTEVARHRVLDGRTWNHPVLVGNRLYVRNGEQAACFEMPLAPSEEIQN